MKTFIFILLILLMLGMLIISLFIKDLITSRIILCCSIISSLLIFKLLGVNKSKS